MTVLPPWLLTMPIALPLILAVASLLMSAPNLKTLGRIGAIGTAGTLIPCLHWVWIRGPIHQSPGGWTAPLGIDLYLDGLSALLLLFTGLTGLGVSFHAAAYFPETPRGQRGRGDLFWPLWFVTWGAMNSLFLTLDLFNVYVTLELISVAGTGLILIAGTPGATRAAFQYQMQALVAGLMYLLGVGLLYNALGTLDLQQTAAALQPGPMAGTGLALMLAGLLVKAALFPLHFWLPRAHADAPAPVSAVLSGLVVTAAYVVAFRIWFAGMHRIAPDALPRLLGALGCGGIVWGGVMALRQDRLKRVLAFSTVSQIGYLFLVFSLTFHDAPGQGMVWAGTVYMAVAHGLSKAAAFLAAGAIQKAEHSDRLEALAGAAFRHPAAVMVLAVASVNLIGLPPSTGFIGKWMMLQAAIHNHQWEIVGALLGGGLLSALYLFRVFERMAAKEADGDKSLEEAPWEPGMGRRGHALLLPAFLLSLATLLPVVFIQMPGELLRIGAPVEFTDFTRPRMSP